MKTGTGECKSFDNINRRRGSAEGRKFHKVGAEWKMQCLAIALLMTPRHPRVTDKCGIYSAKVLHTSRLVTRGPQISLASLISNEHP